MPLEKMLMKPGYNREGTQYTNEGQWYDGDKVRFRKGLPESIGGWEKFTSNSFLGICRSIFRWYTLTSIKYHTIGTHLKYYILEGNAFTDITPIRAAAANLGSNPFDVTSGSATITVNHTDHGAVINDFVTLASSDAVAGIPVGEINAEHQILTTPDADSYTIAVTTSASSNTSGGGTTPPTAEYQLTTGLTTSVNSPGWGAGAWGTGGWGDAKVPAIQDRMRIFHQDNWGEDLIFNVRGFDIFFWDASVGTGTRATLLSAESGADNVPTKCTQILVSQVDRHAIAYGCNELGESALDPLLIRWSDQENLVDWDPTAVNTSGDQRLGVGSKIIAASRGTKGEIIIWTDLGMYAQQYIGPPFTYGFSFIAGDVSLIGPNAAALVNGLVYWMDTNNFYVYDGNVRVLPCSVLDFVFDDIESDEFEQVFIAPNVQYNEISWFYCSEGETAIDRYVTYNYEEEIWYFGSLDRSAWIDSADTEQPLATSMSSTYYLWKHETGQNDDGSALTSYVEGSDIDIGDGDDFMFMSRIIPDITFKGSGSATGTLTIKKRNYPGDGLSTHGTHTITDSTKQVFPRLRTRQAVIRWGSAAANVGWRMGHLRIDNKPDGKR